MSFFVHTCQALFAHVGVDLRCAQIGVTEKLLYSTKIGTSIQKMSGKCMS